MLFTKVHKYQTRIRVEDEVGLSEGRQVKVTVEIDGPSIPDQIIWFRKLGSIYPDLIFGITSEGTPAVISTKLRDSMQLYVLPGVTFLEVPKSEQAVIEPEQGNSPLADVYPGDDDPVMAFMPDFVPKTDHFHGMRLPADSHAVD